MSAQPLEGRMASLEGSYQQVSDRLNSIDRRLDGFEQRVEARFNTVDSGLRVTGSKIDGLQWRLTALILGTWSTIIASIFVHH